MTKSKKIFLGILNIVPILFIILYFVSIIGMVFNAENFAQQNHGNQPDISFLTGIGFALILIFLAVGLMLFNSIFYIIHVTKNPTFVDNDKLIWILIILFAHTIGHTIYWYMKIWKTPHLDEIQKKDLINSIK